MRSSAPPSLPFDLTAASSATLGYELKADCGARNAHASRLPDAVLMLANRVVAVDHARARTTYVLCLADGDERREAERWLDERAGGCVCDLPPTRRPTGARAPRRPRRPRRASGWAAAASRYLADIGAPGRTAAGESYEVCLTDQISTDAPPDPFDLYRNLRRVNPAPFAAFLQLGEVAVRQLLAGALPSRRPRAPGRGAADQGHDPARRGRRPRTPRWPRSCRTTRRPTPST